MTACVCVCMLLYTVLLIFQSQQDIGSARNAELFVAEGMAECLTSLPITPDYAMTEYRALLNVFATNLTPDTA